MNGECDMMRNCIMFSFEKVLTVCTLHLLLLDFWSVSVILYSKQNYVPETGLLLS